MARCAPAAHHGALWRAREQSQEGERGPADASSDLNTEDRRRPAGSAGLS